MNCFKLPTEVTSVVLIGLAFVAFPSNVQGQCSYQPDATDCSCFTDTAVWDPSGGYIQDIAQQTVGTIESCTCAQPQDRPPGCDWDPNPSDPTKSFANSGKPYYQMQLGCDEPFTAFSAAVLLSTDEDAFRGRGAWCSETVAYWHKHAYIPYAGGYRNDRHPDWMVSNARKLVDWYVAERDLREDGGRGWFIYADEVTYNPADFELGRTVPVPGSYIAIRGYDGVATAWRDWALTGHSAIIDEMWVHRDVYGDVYRVEVTIKEGNASDQVQNTDWTASDLASLLPGNSGWLGGTRKIFGFGVDLNSDGTPIYDPSRLHRVDHPFAVYKTFPLAIAADDKDWDASAAKDMADYGRFLANQGGIGISSPDSQSLNFAQLPDGVSEPWTFPMDFPVPFTVEIDLRKNHPMPLKGLVLRWRGGDPPEGYEVRYASSDGPYANAQVTDTGNLALQSETASVPVPVRFGTNGSGANVRFIQVHFPDSFVLENKAVLEELRILMDEGPEQDAEENPGLITHTPDCGAAYAEQSCLWPANHKLVDVAIKGVVGSNGELLAPEIFAISSDEPTASAVGAGRRKHAPDGFFEPGEGSGVARLRAERSGDGDGRVYVVHFTADDAGQQCSGSVTVRVPHNRKSKACLAVDSGQYFDATTIN